MNCLPELPIKMREGAGEPITGSNVQDRQHTGEGDLSEWVELMEAVEMLCPVWPAPEQPNAQKGVFKL